MDNEKAVSTPFFVDLAGVSAITLLFIIIFWVGHRTVSIKTEAETSLAELRQIQVALEAFRQDAGRYPLSSTCPNSVGGGGPWLGQQSHYGGDCQGSCWIPELSDVGACPIPVEKTGENPGVREYLYRSDGRDYKLIYHAAPNLAVKKGYLDPVRRGHAYGFWTEGAKNW